MPSGVRRALDGAVDLATFRPAYAVGYIVGNVLGSVVLLILGRRLTRPFR